MAGNPGKEGKKNRTYQLSRRRYTSVPGYHGVLYRVFPTKKDLSREDAYALLTVLFDVKMTGFALTEHPSTVDGHVTLWLSSECAYFLLDNGYVREVEETEWK